MGFSKHGRILVYVGSCLNSLVKYNLELTCRHLKEI